MSGGGPLNVTRWSVDTFLWQVREGVGAVWPFTLFALLVLAASAWMLVRDDPAIDLRNWRDALLALLTPFLLPIWATLTSGMEKAGRTSGPWRSAVLMLLGLGAIAAAIGVLYRGRKYWPAFLPVALAVSIASVVGVFAGLMQIADAWL